MTPATQRTGTSTALRFAASLSRKSDTEAALRDVADEIHAQLGGGPLDLAFVFFSAHHLAQSRVIASMIRDELRADTCLGCSGEGIITGGEELETSPALTVWAARLPGVRVAPLRLSFSELKDQVRMAGWPEPTSEDGTFLLLADPFTTPLHDVLSILNDRYPNAIALGGLVGGGHGPSENRLLRNEDLFEGGLVGVRLTGRISVRSVISQGCRPVGERFVVTKAERNLVYELGGQPALQRLQDVFESLEGPQRRDVHRALHVGIVIDEHASRFDRGDFLVRNLVGADQRLGAIAIGDTVQEGQTLQFHLRDARSASEDLHILLAAERARCHARILGALLFSCCGRGEGLFGRPHHDSSIVQERLGPVPLAGFFAQGEIGPVAGRNFLHGYTASLALFTEPESEPLAQE
ncbi:MAG TPA: FIST N-terminal domain-containing protein [Nitrospira sp.]|nr:FIST N-terminal domain-containing protein [Nitrospira sp.]